MWTVEKILQEARKCTTLKEFRQNKALVSAACRLNIYNTAIMGLARSRLNKPKTKEEALLRGSKFTSRTECYSNDYPAYISLDENDKNILYGILHTIRVKWSDENILSEAKKYKTITSFKKGSSGAYQAMLKNKNIKNEVYLILEPSKSKKHSFENLQKEALKYSTKQEFKLGSYSHYQAACRHKDFTKICQHMTPGKIATNYKNPMWLYIVKITTKDGSLPTVYKVGVTKRSYILDRFWIDYTKSKTEVEVLFKHKYSVGLEAYNLEQEIIKEFSEYRYTGESPLLRTKTTEMFTTDITRVGISLRACDSNAEPLE